MCRNLPKYTLIERLALMVKALVCAVCLGCSVQTVCADEFVVNEKIMGKLSRDNVATTATSQTCVIPTIEFLGDKYVSIYSRLVLFDAKTQKPLYEISDTCFEYEDPNNILFQQTDKGLILFPRWNATTLTKNVTLKKPKGYSWADIYVGMYYLQLNAPNDWDKEKEIAKRYGINGNIYLKPSITSDPTIWSGFKAYCPTKDNGATFKNTYMPYEGVSQKVGDFETNADGVKRQGTYTWEYTYYVPRRAGEMVTLKAPVANGASGGSDIDYSAYWRWYDNNTYRANDRISKPWGSSLNQTYVDENGKSVGLTYSSTGYKNPTYDNMASVEYTVPDNVTDWQGDDIAADASRYTDFGSLGSNFWREPTLSMRYIFHVRPADEIAENIKKAIMNVEVYEDHGSIAIPLKKDGNSYSKNAHNTLRLDLRGINNYWFYPFSTNDIKNNPSASQFESGIRQCSSISWVAMTTVNGKVYRKDIALNQSNPGDDKYATYDLLPNDVVGTYTMVADPKITYELDSLETGRQYTIMVYANSNDGKSSPIARFDCYYVWQSEPELESLLSEHRQPEILKDKYTQIGWVNFDDFAGMNDYIPTVNYQYGNPYSNHYDGAHNWNQAFYGTVYPQLMFASCEAKGNDNYIPYHGDYILVKTANLKGVSVRKVDGYDWAYGDSPTLYDRTYYTSGGTRCGYFLFVDAADEPRPIATLDFEARLCTGATLMFTANIANLTDKNASEYPQLLFKLYGYKTDANGKVIEKKLIQSFASGDFRAYNSHELGKWYQVFAKSFVHQGLGVDEFSHYNVTIDNACKSTYGADYAIDDIRFYVANDQVEILQTSDADNYCNNKDHGAYLKLRTDYNMTRTFLKVNEGSKPLFYRLCEEGGKPCNTKYPQDTIANPKREQRMDKDSLPYGVVWISTNEKEDEKLVEADPYGYLSLILADAFFNLDLNKTYYVSVALPRIAGYNKTDDTPIYEPDIWGEPKDPCSIYSKSINIRNKNIKITSNTGGTSLTYSSECGKNEIDVDLKVQLRVPDAKYGIEKDIPWKFDFVIGSEKAFNDACSQRNLLQAIEHFRTAYPDATTFDATTHVATGIFSQTEYETLVHYTSQSTTEIPDPAKSDKLIVVLSKSDEYKANLKMVEKNDVNVNFYFISVPGEYTDKGGQKYTICSSAMKEKVTFTYESPVVQMGDPKVTYPEAWNNSAREYRLGLKQANNLKTGTRLRLPIHDYRDAFYYKPGHSYGGASRNNLIVEQPDAKGNAVKGCVRLVATNDPTVNKEWLQVGTVKGVAWGAKVGEVKNAGFNITPTDKSLVIDFSKHTETLHLDNDVTKKDVTANIEFHEGYSYTFSVVYHDATLSIKNDNNTICYGTTLFTLNIVPEYVTWKGSLSSNTNWNNDGNWARSTKAELHINAQKTDGYVDYDGSNGLQSAPGEDPSTTPQIFVPMRFTKVTILPHTLIPQLGSYSYDQRQGILTAESLLNPMLSEATKDINYHLMLKMEPTIEDGVSYYDCENFYANMCQDVYFASTDPDDATQNEEVKGELRNQHYLSYQKAWVDFALPTDQWSMFTVPLHNVYAGDFYLPYATGKQNTEAFQPIKFGEGNGAYDRVKYSVYQRTWFDTNPQVVAADNNGNYGAAVNYDKNNTEVEYVTSEWSHAFNDVQHAYEMGLGYSVYPEPNETSAKNTHWALFRLPKDDATFNYYERGKNGKQKTSAAVDRSKNGLLLTNNNKDDNPMTLNGVIEVKPDALHQRGDYYLIGNPYMATIDMQLFFKDNPNLYAKYWILEGGELKAYGNDGTDNLGSVAPMQAFFVKASTGGVLLGNIVFRPSQCITIFNTNTKVNRRHTALTLHARHAQGVSTARVLTDDAANNDFDDSEDVEVIFDHELVKAPQIYTVSGNRAAAINHLTSLRNVPLGVEAETDEEVAFSVSGTNLLPAPLYLLDAKTNQYTLLTDSVKVMLQPNQVGRYFLTSNMSEANPVQTDLRCYSVHAGKVVAATTEGDLLTSIDVFDILGRHLQTLTPQQLVYSFNLPQGVYLITVSSKKVTEGRTFKVIVK